MSRFKKELVASHCVEDYFFDLNISHKAPMEILRDKNPVWYKEMKDKWMEKHS